LRQKGGWSLTGCRGSFQQGLPANLIAMAIHKLIQERVTVVVSLLIDAYGYCGFAPMLGLWIVEITNGIGSASFERG